MAQDFDEFVSANACLDDQRGTIMERNSCRGPWQNRLDFSIRQSLPAVRGQRVSVQLDILNYSLAIRRGQLEFPTLARLPKQRCHTAARSVGSLTRR